MAAPPSQRTVLQSALVVGLAGMAAFATAARFPFVYDDRWTIVQNQWLSAPLREVLALVMNGSANGAGVPDATRPSMIVSLWVDRRLFGASPPGFHLHSLWLYSVACAAAFAAALSLLRDVRAALAAGLFFALAPVHAEVVAAVNYREDLIAALGVLTPVAWLFRRSPAKDTVAAGVGVAAVWAWGLLGKESACALVPLVPVIALVVGKDRVWLEARERTLWLLGAAGVLWLNWRLAVAIGGDGLPRAEPSEVWTRVIDTGRFTMRALGSALVPIRSSPEYAGLDSASPWWLGGLAGVVVVVWALSRSASTRPFAVGLGLAAVAPLGASPLVGPVNVWADRYVFVGVFGGAVIFGTLMARVTRRSGDRWALAGGFALAVAAAFWCTRAASVWASERALWTYAVARAPESARAWGALSRVERLDGNLDEADRLMARALGVKSNDVSARVTQVYNLLARGNVDSARNVIALLERLGAGGHPALARARVCALLAPEAAKRCIRGGS